MSSESNDRLLSTVRAAHRSDAEASRFSCLPRCECGWVGQRVRRFGLSSTKFIHKAVGQYGRHVVAQLLAAEDVNEA